MIQPQISNDIMQQIFDSQTTALLYLDTKMVVQYVNPATEMLTRVSARNSAGVALAKLLPLAGPLLDHAKESLGNGDPITVRDEELEVRPGQYELVDYAITPVAAQGGGLLIEIISNRTLGSREDSLHKQHLGTRAVVRGVAHEIKNPLGGIRGAAQLLQRALMKLGFAEKVQWDLDEYIDIIVGEVDRLTSLVDRMLGPSRPPQMAELNVHQVVERVRQLAAAEAQDNIEVIRDYDPSVPDILGDQALLIQALLNIVRNGLQVLADEGGILTLRTRVVRRVAINGEFCKLAASITVADTGPGIPKAQQDAIFFPMVTNKADGTGLGLSIAQALIAQHSGSIEVFSEPGNTRFTLLLPI